MRMAFAPIEGWTPFICGEDGRLLSSLWVDYLFREYPLLRMITAPAAEDAVFLPGEWCFLSKMYASNYWHFTYEVLDQVFLLEKSGYAGRYILPRTPFAADLTALLGVDPGRIAWKEDFDPARVYRFENLVCTELLRDDRKRSAPVLLEAASRMLEALPGSDRPSPGRIFIRRTGTRRLLLPERSEAMLERCGFRTVVPDGLPAAEQIRLFSRARIVLSPHGANSANSLYMRPGSVIMETFPKAYANACCLETAYLGGVYYLPVPETHGRLGRLPDPYADYRIDPHLLEMSVRAAVALAEGREERG